jgi:hypothetical protein
MELQKDLRAKYSGPLIKPAKKTPETAMTHVTPTLEPILFPRQSVVLHEEEAPQTDGQGNPKKRSEALLIWCGLGLLLVNLAGTWISFRAANAARDRASEANQLTRQLLRGTSAAHIVTKVASQEIRPDSRQIRIGFENDGKVNALNLQGDATVCLMSFPAWEKISCKTLPVSKSQLGFEGDQLTLAFDGIVGDGGVTMLEANRATVQYSSTFRFNDGFDDPIDESTCQMYLVRHSLISDRVQERSWTNCDVGKTLLANEARRRAEQ